MGFNSFLYFSCNYCLQLGAVEMSQSETKTMTEAVEKNPFELFDSPWFKDATSQLCADGWPAFIVPLNIGIRQAREAYSALKEEINHLSHIIQSQANLITSQGARDIDQLDQIYRLESRDKVWLAREDALKAEVEKLKIENAHLIIDLDDAAKVNDNCQNKIVSLESENEKLNKALYAIDWHIRDMQNEKIISMSEMVRALKVISDTLSKHDKKESK